MVGSLSITLILLTFLLSHDREHFDAHLAGFIYYMTKKLKPSACLAVFSLVVVCMSEKRKNSDQVCGFFLKKLSSRTFISLFCNIDIVFTSHHTSLNRDMSEVSLLITALEVKTKYHTAMIWW